MIFDIQRFCTHDGPGIRTVVFFKGCPLRCPWCHSPESRRFERELFFTPALCIGCGECVRVCPAGAHIERNEQHVIDRARCCLCMRCAEVCVSRALEPAGRAVTVEEIISEVERDRVFYEESGGGITLSGGEPMAQFEPAGELLRQAKERGIHTCMETCGFAPTERFREIAPLVDLFLWDIKHTDPAMHEELTAAPLQPVIDNLALVDSLGVPTVLRCILVPEINLTAEHLDAVARIYEGLDNCRGIELLPYHELGASKLERLGLPAGRTFRTPTTEEIAAARTYVKTRTNGAEHSDYTDQARGRHGTQCSRQPL